MAGSHALFVAAPFQGHFPAAADLAIKLASKGFVVTFACTEAYQQQRTASGASSADHNDLFAGARSQGLDIRYELISDGLPDSVDRSGNPEAFFDALLHRIAPHAEALIQKLMLAEPPIDVIIADTFFVWPSTLGKKYGLPFVSFWTKPALVLSLYFHMDLLLAHGHYGSPENRKDTITYIPGVPSIEPTELVSYLQESDTTTTLQRILVKSFEQAKGADFVLANMVEDLEVEAVAVLRQKKTFYPVGPIFPDGFTDGTVVTSLWPESDCSPWLDSMPPGSVLYISFGSIGSISKRDLVEIAYGVLNSKANFLWVIRPETSGSGAVGDLLPDGFQEAISGRGMVVPWCRQKEVLLHPSVGGFLTHCGWNSVLESMWCGVPMLCFPLFTDQPPNQKLVVQNLGIGMDLGGLGEVSRDKVSSRIDELIGRVAGVKVREKMEEVKRTVRGAVAPQGSSCKNLDKFIVELSDLLSKKDGSVVTGVKRD